MATATCGGTTINYDGGYCDYICSCQRNSECRWTLHCGSYTTSGTGQESGHHRLPQVTIAGDLATCARSLSKMWGRPIIVPKILVGKRVQKRTVKGTQEEIARALGFKLSAKRKA